MIPPKICVEKETGEICKSIVYGPIPSHTCPHTQTTTKPDRILIFVVVLNRSTRNQEIKDMELIKVFNYEV